MRLYLDKIVILTLSVVIPTSCSSNADTPNVNRITTSTLYDLSQRCTGDHYFTIRDGRFTSYDSGKKDILADNATLEETQNGALLSTPLKNFTIKIAFSIAGKVAMISDVKSSPDVDSGEWASIDPHGIMKPYVHQTLDELKRMGPYELCEK